MEGISIERRRELWRKEEEEAAAKKAVVPQNTALMPIQDTVSSSNDPLPVHSTNSQKKNGSSAGWSQHDTLTSAERDPSFIRAQLPPTKSSSAVSEQREIQSVPAAAEEEMGLFGMLANAVTELVVGLKSHFLAEKHRPTAPDTAPHPYRFKANPFESHNLSEEDIREYRRLETALARWLDKSDSIRRDIGMDAVFLLLMQLMMEGKKDEFMVARKKLSQSYRERAKDLDERLDVLEEITQSIKNNRWWTSFARANTFISMAVYAGSAATAEGGGAAAALLLAPCAIGFLNQIAGDPIAKYAGKVTAFITKGDEKIHAQRLQMALDLALAATSLYQSGVPRGNTLLKKWQEAGQTFSLVSGTTNSVGQVLQANTKHEEQVRTGKLTRLEGDIRDADEEIKSQTKDGLKKPLDGRNQIFKALIDHLHQLDELNKQSIRNIG